MKKAAKVFLSILGLSAITYWLGPAPQPLRMSTDLPVVPSDVNRLEHYIKQKESRYTLRADNEAHIVWADSMKQQTEYAFLYLHGFSASQGEGSPVHTNIAQKFGANLYLARYAGHGIDESPQLKGFTAKEAWYDVKEALQITRKLGKKVIIMSTSTGGTYALTLASRYPQHVHALINLSPNIRLHSATARLLNNPWGLQLAKTLVGENRYISQQENRGYRYWDSLYTVKALVELEHLVEETMNRQTFEKISCPVLTLFYKKDEQHHDRVIDLDAIPKAHVAFQTPDSLNIYRALAEPGNHVLASPIKSENIEVVEEAITSFCIKKLGMSMKPATP